MDLMILVIKKENKMINSIRPIQPISAAAEKARRVIVKASSILPPLNQPKPLQAIYTSPFAPISMPISSGGVGKILNFFG